MSLLRAAATVSSLTLLSRITGLARDILIARAFGAGALTDAFWVAFRIPNLLRRLFAEGAFAQAFVPILGEVRNQHESEAVKTLLDRVAITLFLVLSLTTILGVIGAPWVVMAMASGLTEPQRASDFESAVWMTRMMFLTLSACHWWLLLQAFSTLGDALQYLHLPRFCSTCP